ncbi:hypothetical protein CYG49_03735 [Candidatus Saccharibacteria bacterium]|nr:MAG: hypothetical protein CYG49_03735 [Candidatus Saccharibacteria bacterium]
MSSLSPVSRRLLPLYVSAFLQCVVFWYAIEKLFMTSIGFTTTTIGLMVAVMSVTILLTETPSGILADRWSRKGVMVLGCIFLLLSAVVASISHNEAIFIGSTVLWGIYNALYTGTYDSVIYDTVLEETGEATLFDRFLGRLRAIEGFGFIIGALGGGLIASAFSLRHTYFMTIPFLIVAIFVMLQFREPSLHKKDVAEPLLQHVRQTLAAVLKHRSLLSIVVAITGFTVLQNIFYELYQLWFIAAAAPVGLFGLIGAVVFATWMIGGFVAERLKSKRAKISTCLIVGISLAVLLFPLRAEVLLTAQFVLGTSLVVLSILLSHELHRKLPSHLRAGSASVVSTLGRLVIIPGSIVFTAVADSFSIYRATFLLLGIAVVACFAYVINLHQYRPIKA